jgi:hypothetical protein
MAIYSYSKSYNTLDEGKLVGECQAANLPVTDVQRVGDQNETVLVITSRDLTSGEATTLDALVTAHDGRLRTKRDLLDIVTDLQTLSANQKTNISNALFTPPGSPPILTDSGPNAASIWSLYAMIQLNGVTTADKNTIKLYAAAQYVQDNPRYLATPAFDNTINVPGDEIA